MEYFKENLLFLGPTGLFALVGVSYTLRRVIRYLSDRAKIRKGLPVNRPGYIPPPAEGGAPPYIPPPMASLFTAPDGGPDIIKFPTETRGLPDDDVGHPPVANMLANLRISVDMVGPHVVLTVEGDNGSRAKCRLRPKS